MGRGQSGDAPLADLAIWLDITRLTSRVGRAALTGVDRVEFAYLEWALAQPGPVRLLCRTGRGYLLLSPEAGPVLVDMLAKPLSLGRADAISRLTGKGSEPRHRAEAALRRFAVDRAPPWALRRLCDRQIAGPTVYLNTGHSNLSRRTLTALAGHPALKLAVLVHDLIPLDHPEFVTEGLPDRFRGKMAQVANAADLIIVNSQVTERQFHDHARANGWPVPPICVAHLGLSDPPLGSGASKITVPDHPYFVALGTLEPRKNHTVLLDAWDHLAAVLPPGDLPQLHIVGHRGWLSDPLFQRLDTHPLRGRAVIEHGPLPDAEMRDLVRGARALLFPSLAEGFGLPPAEALRDGVVPICSDLPVLREILGDRAVYLDPHDAYSWAETIKQGLAGKDIAAKAGAGPLPSWPAHFRLVSAALSRLGAAGQKGKG